MKRQLRQWQSVQGPVYAVREAGSVRWDVFMRAANGGMALVGQVAPTRHRGFRRAYDAIPPDGTAMPRPFPPDAVVRKVLGISPSDADGLDFGYL